MAAPSEEYPTAKKLKRNNGPASDMESVASREHCGEDNSIHVPLISFKSFELCRVLNEIPDKKLTFIHGKFTGSDEDAIVILEKTAFKSDTISNILSKDTVLENTQHNDIYSTYDGFLDPKFNGNLDNVSLLKFGWQLVLNTRPYIHQAIKTTLIYPATHKHIQKYSAYDLHIVEEQAKDYCTITLPHIETKAFQTKWVHNILDKKSEADRIIYEDPDPDIGFVLLPDYKWNREQVADLHLMAIVHRRDVRSIRELNDTHLTLLENINTKVKQAVKEKFDMPGNQLRLFFHYQPSYYHLHVHVCHVKFDAPGISIGRGHLLSDVIQNIKLKATYYQDSSITMLLSDTDDLYLKFKEAGRLET